MNNIRGRFIVEEWESCETIAEFSTEQEREAWLRANVDEYGFTKDGVQVSIYEII